VYLSSTLEDNTPLTVTTLERLAPPPSPRRLTVAPTLSTVTRVTPTARQTSPPSLRAASARVATIVAKVRAAPATPEVRSAHEADRSRLPSTWHAAYGPPRASLALVLPQPTATPAPAPTVATATPSPTPTISPFAAPSPAGQNFGGLFSQNYPPALAAASDLAEIHARLSGPVHIRVDIDETGHATEVRFMGTLADSALEQDIRSALLALHYVPADCNGLHCEGTLEIRY
jgi:hypothetical protein